MGKQAVVRGAWCTTAVLIASAAMTTLPTGAARAASGDEGPFSLGTASGLAGETVWGPSSAQASRQALVAGSWDPARDPGSMSSLTRDTGAQRAWARGFTGRDVTVAVIDTGIAPVAGLTGAGKLHNGPDLSYEGQAPGTRYVDGYGHGTHLAGIMAGEDDGFDPRHPDAGTFAGVAPDAGLLNLKVATGDGGADVTQVIAALDWVVQHRADDGMNVRVVNLAYGTESTQPWQVDPLAKAVENAWDHGVVVVAAAGNDGLGASRLLMPAVDPHVLAVGALDDNGTAWTNDDTVADFSSGGTSGRRPDVIAPGRSLVSLRVPGSYADLRHPEGRVEGDASGRYFRGTGTSQATAVVAGEVALLLSARPSLSPDQVKSVLRDSAAPLPGGDAAQGAGVVDVNAAINTATSLVAPKSPAARRLPGDGDALPASTGTGSVEASRGGEHVVDPATGQALVGELDAQGEPWRGAQWAAASQDARAWTGGTWNQRTWAGDAWLQHSFAAAPWSGLSWSGVPWADHAWSDAQWEARSWRTDGWQARSWREASWLARSWRDLDAS